MTGRQFAILCALALTWGCSFLFIKVIIDAGVEPMGMSGFRTALGAATLLPFAWRERAGFRQPATTWLALLGLGVLNFAIPWTIFGIAETHVPSGAAAVANASTPLWSAILATALLKADTIGPQRVAGLALGFAGVLVLMGGDLTQLSGSETLSILLILVATLCYGASAVSIRKWLGHVPAVPLATAQVSTAAVLLLPAALLTGAYENADITTEVMLSAAALGAFGSGLSVVAYMYLIQNAGPVRASVVTYMVPPLGVLLGWLFLNESIGWNLVAALGFILAGVAMVQGLNPRSLAARFPGRLVPAAAPSD